ncbi:MAG: M1 family metallopeptidase, partial [FCB group bacterium]|nr:M1 family metallopeptidase [FCB group bacterium]
MKTVLIIACITLVFTTLSAAAGPEDDAAFRTKAEAAMEFRRLEGQMKSANFEGLDADSAHSWDALHYNLQLEFFPSTQQISGTTTITGKVADSLMNSVDMHFHPGMSISNVTCAGMNTEYSWIYDDLIIDLDHTYLQDDTFEVAVTYAGTPSTIWTPLWPMTISWGSVIWSFTDPEGARVWFPCFDKPFDKATYSAQYTVPQGWITASNGALDSTVTNPNSTVTTYWNHIYPIETYLISICISNYRIFYDSWNEIPIHYYVYPSLYTAAQNDFEPIPDMMECYAGLFGEYPFEKYGMAVAPLGGGMEHQTMVTIGASLITGMGTYEFIFTHELSHMWWGDALSLIDWPHMWLNEGFATYSEAVWAEDAYGYDYMLYYVQNYLQNYYMNWETPSNRYPTFDPPEVLLFSPLTYEKPGSVLHMIRYMLGDGDFYSALQEYYYTYQYGNVSSDDFQEIIESYYGEDLDWFFQQWIYEAGFPVFEYLYSMQESAPDTWDITLTVIQTQDEELPDFITPIDIGVFIGGIPVDTISAWIYSRSEVIEFQYSGAQPDSIVLDFDSWILGRKIFNGALIEPIFVMQDFEWSGGYAYPGTIAELYITLENTGMSSGEIIGTLNTAEPVTITNNTASFGSIIYTQSGVNQTPFTIEIPAWLNSYWGGFELTLTGGVGDTTLFFNLPLGAPNVLYVDDDGGANTEIKAEMILDSTMVVYYRWDVALAGTPSGLNDYDAVVWACGHTSETLNQAEKDTIAGYLDGGGKLFISGTNIASGLQGDSFLQEYLHIAYNSQYGMLIINGVPGDPIGDGLSVLIASAPSDQDKINPVNGG